MLKRTDSDVAVIRKCRETMDRQATQLTRLVEDLLDVSRITRDKLELRLEPVALSAVVHQAVEVCRPQAELAGHRVEVSLPAKPILLRADAARLCQVFSNLLNNACKYSQPGGRIELSAELQNGTAVVTVKDNGMGIPADQLDSVFEMFAQVGHHTTWSQGGLGIGLTLVRRLVEMHQGTVEARSEGIGKGSEFVVRLPTLDDASELAGPVAPQSMPTSSSQSAMQP